MAHQDCLAVVWAVLLLWLYLEGRRYTVCTDHEALKWILCLMDLTEELAPWALRLSKFEFDRVCIKYQATDPLLCLKTTGEYEKQIEDGISVLSITPSNTPKPKMRGL